jgi:hypothetical protein
VKVEGHAFRFYRTFDASAGLLAMPMANAFYAAKFPTNYQRGLNHGQIEMFSQQHS